MTTTTATKPPRATGTSRWLTQNRGKLALAAFFAFVLFSALFTMDTNDWFITITGAKVEELSMNSVTMSDTAARSRREICSITGAWPTESYEYGGQQFDLPKILSR